MFRSGTHRQDDPDLASIFAKLQASADDLLVSPNETKRRETSKLFNRFMTAMPDGTTLPQPPRKIVPAPQTGVTVPLCGNDKVKIVAESKKFHL